MEVRDLDRVPDADRDIAALPPTTAPGPIATRLLALQRGAGNAAVGRMLARRAATVGRRALTRYADPGVQAAADAYKGTMSDDRAGALELLDREHDAIAGPWSKLDWASVAKGAADRALHPEHIQQNPLGLCGPAAVANYMASVTPGTYAYDVISIFEDGKWGGDKVNATLLGNTPAAGMDQADWMLLSAIQDVTNYVLDYDGRTALIAEGQFAAQVENTMTSFTKISKTTTYDCRLWGVKTQSDKVSDLMRKYGDGVCVVMFVDSKRFQNETQSGKRDHFIRLLKPIDYGEDNVTFEVFSWGRNWTKTFKRPHFESMVYNYIVGGVGAVDL